MRQRQPNRSVPPPTTRWGDFGSHMSLPQLIVARVRANPGRVVIHDMDEGVKMTYAELHATSLRWAAALAAQGVAEGDTVLMMVPNRAESYALWFAIGWLRAVAVPVNIDFRGNMLRHVAALSRAKIAVVAGQFLPELRSVAAEIADLETVIVGDGDPPPGMPWRMLSRGAALASPAAELEPPGWTDPSIVLFTGGTTGPSKGALIQWAYWHTYGDLPPAIQGEDCTIYSPWPVWHSSGLYGIANVIYRNGTLALRARWHTRRFWSDVREAGVTGAMLLGGVANLIWQDPLSPDDRDNPLRHISIQPIFMDHQAFEERFDVKVQSGYGTTEGGTVLLCQWPLPNGRTCGVPTPGFQARLVDSDGNDVGPNVVGELWLKPDDPAQMFREYLNMPEATAAAWKDGWFHTADAFWQDEEGFFYFSDRLKDSIRRRGENISSIELEKEINAFPAVVESAVVAARDDIGGEEVLAFVVRKPDQAMTAQELIAFLEPRVPRFMVPRYVEFIDALPKTPASGRVRKLELRDRGLGAGTWDREASAVDGR